MFKKILVATDLSEISEQIINAIPSLRSIGTEEIVLVHCLNIRDVGGLANTLSPLIQPVLNKQQTQLTEQGFNTRTEIRIGIPAIEINRAAQEKDCSLIVVGSHGYNLTKDILLGGVTTAVLHTATRPVLVIKIEPDEAKGSKPSPWNPLHHILYPTDFSDNAEAAFLYLEEIVAAGAAKVTLLHIQDHIFGVHVKDRLEVFNRIDRERLIQLAERLQAKNNKTEIVIDVIYGSVAGEVIKLIKEQPVSMVVIGAQGRGHIGEMCLGSVSNKVVRYSPVPVILVPLVHS
uniref:Universal stress protein n=1 Tax=candidate division WOR-3 bacterium TaxID=2052148 RepID=A0A7V3PU26_UNCW3